MNNLLPLYPLFGLGPISISFPVGFFNGQKRAIRTSCLWDIPVFYYGAVGIIILNPPWYQCGDSVNKQILDRIRSLIAEGMLAPFLEDCSDEYLQSQFKIHDLQFYFDFPSKQYVECWRPDFWLDGETYHSRDYRKIHRSDGELKGTQFSLISYKPIVSNSKNSPWRLCIRLSGRYRSMVSWHDLDGSPIEVFRQLSPRIATRLTHIVKAETLKINSTYRYFLLNDFWHLFEQAKWFSGNAHRRLRFRTPA